MHVHTEAYSLCLVTHLDFSVSKKEQEHAQNVRREQSAYQLKRSLKNAHMASIIQMDHVSSVQLDLLACLSFKSVYLAHTPLRAKLPAFNVQEVSYEKLISGHSCLSIEEEPEKCNPGFISETGQRECTPCPAGHHCPTPYI